MRYLINNRRVKKAEFDLHKEDEVYQIYKGKVLICEHYYLNGQWHGLQRNWYTNGQLSYEHNYLNGQAYGLFRRWYANGQLRYEHNYLNGQWHGLQRNWYTNGQLKYEYIFVNDKDRTKDLKNNKLAQVVIFGKVIHDIQNQL